MSLTAFKRKSVINHGSKRSGISPSGVWIQQGPFGNSTNGLQITLSNPSSAGFSINGGTRNKGGVGKDMKMSKSGTPYKGINPVGYGGHYGKYTTSQPILNAPIVDTFSTQNLYIKPSVLSTRGMLHKKYKWAYNGQYPNFWVQPNHTGNLTDNTSQSQYIQNKTAANTCTLDVNNLGTYERYIVNSKPALCRPGNTSTRHNFNNMARNIPYTKKVHQSVSYDQYNAHIRRGCNNPLGIQKPFPFAVNGDSCNTEIYLSPPEWYTQSRATQQFSSNTPNTNPYYYIHSYRNQSGLAEPPQTTLFNSM